MMSVNREKVGVTLLTIAITSSILIFYNNWVYAQANQTATSVAASSSKFIGAGMAFGLAAAGSGIGLGFVGMVESIAIYGIVMMFIILGQ